MPILYDGTAPTLDLYIDPSGSDASPGTLAQPWRTPQHAVNYIRGNGLNTTGPWGDVVVHHAVGDYAPPALTDADSGVGRLVRYVGTSTPSAARWISARLVTGWTLYSGSIYRVQVTDCAPNSLWENGVRARKARTPDFVLDATHPLAQATYLATEGVNGSSTVLQYVNGNISPGAWNLTDAQIVIHSGGGQGIDYGSDIVPISSLNLGARQFTLAHATRYGNNTGARYFVQGVLDLLDGPGQFHYDSVGQWLYYWPNTAPISSQSIYIPTSQDALTLIGADSSHTVRNVSFENLGIGYSDVGVWYRHAYPNDGESGEGHLYPGYDRQYTHPMARHGSVRMENADHCRFRNCLIKGNGYHAVYLRQLNQGHRFENTWIDDSGVNGVYFEGNYPGEGDVVSTNVINNFKGTNTGVLSCWGGAITFANCGNNTARNIEIGGTTRSAMALYTYVGIAKADNYARNNRISYFYFHDIMQDTLDGAALYTAMLSDDDTTNGINYWDQGIIDKVSAHASVGATSQNGIYVDGFAPGQVITNVKVTNQAGAVLQISPNSDGGTYTNVSAVATVSADVGLTPSFPSNWAAWT